jgi:hypothetical protein
MRKLDYLSEKRISKKQMKIKCENIKLFEQETELKKIFVDGTSTFFRKEIKYTTETKKFEYFIGNKLFKILIRRSIPLDCIKHCYCETIKLH